MLLGFAALASAYSPAADEDLFVGVFESETRENFGSSTPGEWRIEVVAPSTGKYVATFYRSEALLGQFELVPCAEEKEGYFMNRPAGRAEVLCRDIGAGSFYAFLSYAENGINVPAIKQKYIDNPGLATQEGLKPGDPSGFEMRHHRAKYYAHAQAFFYAFRKVHP